MRIGSTRLGDGDAASNLDADRPVQGHVVPVAKLWQVLEMTCAGAA
jgi:hypothetical protein